jgi:Rrf2 family protein
MIKISKKAQYGLRAMVLLARNYKSKHILSTREMANMEGISFKFLERIIMQLEKAKLVKGIKGAQGGYLLARNPSKINTNDVVSILEDNKQTVDCSFCGRKKECLTKDVWSKVDLVLNKTLKSITLKDLIK